MMDFGSTKESHDYTFAYSLVVFSVEMEDFSPSLQQGVDVLPSDG